LTVENRVEFDKDLAATRNFHALDGAGYFHAPHDAILRALLLDVFQYVLVLLLVPQLIRRDHVEQAEHLGGRTGGDHIRQTRHLQHDGLRGVGGVLGILGAHAGSLDNQFLVTQLHSIQAGN